MEATKEFKKAWSEQRKKIKCPERELRIHTLNLNIGAGKLLRKL